MLVLAVELELGPAAELVDVMDEVLAEPIRQIDQLPLALLVPRALHRRDVLIQHHGFAACCVLLQSTRVYDYII